MDIHDSIVLVVAHRQHPGIDPVVALMQVDRNALNVVAVRVTRVLEILAGNDQLVSVRVDFTRALILGEPPQGILVRVLRLYRPIELRHDHLERL